MRSRSRPAMRSRSSCPYRRAIRRLLTGKTSHRGILRLGPYLVLVAGLPKRLKQTEAGAVDEHFDVGAEPVEPQGEPLPILGNGQISPDRHRSVRSAQLIGEARELFLSAGHECHAMSSLGE